jgi:hypothetical protein
VVCSTTTRIHFGRVKEGGICRANTFFLYKAKDLSAPLEISVTLEALEQSGDEVWNCDSISDKDIYESEDSVISINWENKGIKEELLMHE